MLNSSKLNIQYLYNAGQFTKTFVKALGKDRKVPNQVQNLLFYLPKMYVHVYFVHPAMPNCTKQCRNKLVLIVVNGVFCHVQDKQWSTNHYTENKLKIEKHEPHLKLKTYLSTFIR